MIRKIQQEPQRNPEIADSNMAQTKLATKLVQAALKGDCSTVRQLLDDDDKHAKIATDARPPPLLATPLIAALASGDIGTGRCQRSISQLPQRPILLAET